MFESREGDMEPIEQSQPATAEGYTLADLIYRLKGSPEARPLISILSPHLAEARILQFDPNRTKIIRIPKIKVVFSRGQTRITILELAMAVMAIHMLLQIGDYWRKRLGVPIWRAAVKVSRSIHDRLKKMLKNKSESLQTISEETTFSRMLMEANESAYRERFRNMIGRMRMHLQWVEKIPDASSVARGMYQFLKEFPGAQIKSIKPGDRGLDGLAKLSIIIKDAAILITLFKFFSKHERWTAQTIEMFYEFIGKKGHVPPHVIMADAAALFAVSIQKALLSLQTIVMSAKILKAQAKNGKKKLD